MQRYHCYQCELDYFSNKSVSLSVVFILYHNNWPKIIINFTLSLHFFTHWKFALMSWNVRETSYIHSCTHAGLQFPAASVAYKYGRRGFQFPALLRSRSDYLLLIWVCPCGWTSSLLFITLFQSVNSQPSCSLWLRLHSAIPACDTHFTLTTFLDQLIWICIQ